MIDFSKIEKHMPDPLVSLLTDELYEARFEIQLDGSMWCSDSNASIDPHELAIKIRKVLGL